MKYRSLSPLFHSIILLLLPLLLSAQAKPVTFIKNGTSNWNIVAVSAQPQVAFAANELQKYLSQISGCKLPVVNSRGRASGIIVGLRDEIPAKYRSLLPAKKEGFDGYSVVVSQNPVVIIIAGDNERGTIYGTYDFLEHLGCRWFYPPDDKNDPEVVPKMKTLAMAQNAWAIASPIRHRICFLAITPEMGQYKVDWLMKNRFNMLAWPILKGSLGDQYKLMGEMGIIDALQKRGLTLYGPAQFFDYLLPADKYMKDHPEWFGMRNGKRVPQTMLGAQFCWSNADARKEVIENAVKFLKQAPLIHIFCPSSFDGGVSCECDNCKKAGASNLLMVMLSEMIKKLQVSCPNVLIETLGGYPPVTEPPTNLDIIDPNLRIVWAQWGRYHGIGFDDPGYDLTNLDNWRKAAKGGYNICQYYADNFAEPWVMGPFAISIKGDRPYFIKHKVDAFTLFSFSNGYCWNHGLNMYLSGRCYYDTNLDPYAEIKDYAMHYYGDKAGALIGEYYTEWAKKIDISYHVRGNSTPEDRAMLAAERKNWIEPAIAATKNDKVYAYRVAKVEKLHALTESLMEGHRLHNIVQQLRSEGKFDEATQVLDKAKAHTDNSIAMFYKLDSLKQGLVDTQDASGFIFTKTAVKGWIDEEAKLIAAKDRNIPNYVKKLSPADMIPGNQP